jgi:polyisoprenoid-binding protein YceI
MSSTAIEIPGYIAGTWTIDPVHSDVAFTARHMMVSKVRGHFTRLEGQFVTAADPLASSVTATIDLDSIDTNNAQRDDDLRSANFFGVEDHPKMTYRSTAIRHSQDGFGVDAELTLHGVTRQVTLALDVNGFTRDPFGATAPDSQPPPRSTAKPSASPPTCPWTAAAWSSATRSRSSSRSKRSWPNPSPRERPRSTRNSPPLWPSADAWRLPGSTWPAEAVRHLPRAWPAGVRRGTARRPSGQEPVGAENPVHLTRPGILVDQPAEAIQPHDRYVGRWSSLPAGRRQPFDVSERRHLSQGSVRTVHVVVIGVLGQYRHQLLVSEDQHPVQ